MCRMMASYEEACMKERLAKVCKATPVYPYSKFTLADSIVSLACARSERHVANIPSEKHQMSN